MLDWLKSSLPARAGLAVALIAILALCSTFSAILIAWVSEDDAAAMNTAGSLRMATYRLSWNLETQAPQSLIIELRDDMQKRLNNPELQQRLENDPEGVIRQAYQEVQRQWQNHLLPALMQNDKEAFQQHAEPFIQQLERFIQLLQQQSEKRQIWQQGIQGAVLLLIIVILLVGMHELQTSVIAPLQELVSTTERFRTGDLQARIAYQSSDELGHMANSFNAMADAIEESHRTLENRVAEKTQNLARSNAALELLLLSSRNIALKPASAEQLEALIDRFQSNLPGLRLTLCLHGDGEKVARPIVLHGNALRRICSSNDCSDCRYRTENTQNIPINSQGQSLGELKASYLDNHPAAPWEALLTQALADLIGTSLSLERQREQDNRLVLLDERTTIARELHDSLAQELSYMKIQVSRLQTFIRREENSERIFQVCDELREGLNHAYRHLRELLTTFRLQIQDGGLTSALEDTVREFSQKGSLQILLHCEALAFNLTATEQIHLLQIVREALSNCVRHARASQAWVYLRQVGEQVELQVEDDGQGFTAISDARQHHGLHIMQERARSLNGTLNISPRQPNGVRLLLHFSPEFLRNLSGDVRP